LTRGPRSLTVPLLLSTLLIASGATAQEALADPTQAPTTVTEYEIGPEDILRVTVYGHEDLTQTVLVQADGTFMFPLVGTVKASDMTPLALERKIVALLSQGYIRNPQVTVVVQEYRSKTVFVVGEVSRPGSYPFAGQGMTLVEVLAKAGPMTVNAGAEVVVVRPRPGSQVTGPLLPFEVGEGDGEHDEFEAPDADVFRINIRDIQEGELEKNIELKPKDTVFVPQAPKVFVTGEVRNPGAYPWFPGMSARQLISVAGGLTPAGSDGRLKIVRKEEDGETREDGIKKDEDVLPGETLVVRRRLF
jgi:polysaccharide export outer membrane protein